MDVEAEAVYVDILRSLQSSILNSASVSHITNNELPVQCFKSCLLGSGPPVLIRVTFYGIGTWSTGSVRTKSEGPRLAYPPYERKNKVTVGACPR
jgi:hypothetical protein